MVEKRKGYKLIKEFDASEPIVSMITFEGTIFVATTKRVFKMIDEKLKELQIEEEINA